MKKLVLLLAAATFVAACSKDAKEFDDFPLIVDGLTITVETPGTLAELLARFDAEAITELIVRGNLNSDDFVALRNNLPNLAVLDMESADLEELPYEAFYSKESLTAVRLPKNLKIIGGSVFRNCSSLTSVVIPKGLTSIGGGAFRDCSSLTSMTIPQSVTSIGSYAFWGCKNWTGELMIPKGATEIEDGTFANCNSLTGKLEIPKGVTKIGTSAFGNCKNLTGKLDIPEGVTEIGATAFLNCENLTGKLVIPQGVKHITARSFKGCSGLTSITFPQSMAMIYCTAFRECNNVTAIYCKATEPPMVYKIKGENVPAGDNFNYAATLYVPVGTAEAYKTTGSWKRFSNIVEMEF